MSVRWDAKANQKQFAAARELRQCCNSVEMLELISKTYTRAWTPYTCICQKHKRRPGILIYLQRKNRRLITKIGTRWC